MSVDIGIAARTIAGIRSTTALHHGCLGWDTPGIVKALEAVGYSAGAVAAACLAADDPKLDKPSAAGFRAHWPVNASTQPRTSHDLECPDHAGEIAGACSRCRAERQGALDDPSVAEAIAEARRAAVAARANAPRAKDAPTTQLTSAEELARARARADKDAP